MAKEEKAQNVEHTRTKSHDDEDFCVVGVFGIGLRRFIVDRVDSRCNSRAASLGISTCRLFLNKKLLCVREHPFILQPLQ